jgi:hypothetical protein
MSDTPETDAQITTFESISKLKRRFKNKTGTVSAEFARRIERERDFAQDCLRDELAHPSRDVEVQALKIERDVLWGVYNAAKKLHDLLWHNVGDTADFSMEIKTDNMDDAHKLRDSLCKLKEALAAVQKEEAK